MMMMMENMKKIMYKTGDDDYEAHCWWKKYLCWPWNEFVSISIANGKCTTQKKKKAKMKQANLVIDANKSTSYFKYFSNKNAFSWKLDDRWEIVHDRIPLNWIDQRQEKTINFISFRSFAKTENRLFASIARKTKISLFSISHSLAFELGKRLMWMN